MINPVKPTIEHSDFEKIDIRVGTVISAEKVEGSDKLIKLVVDFGELGQRQILTGMATWYSAEDFVGKQTTFVLNLKPRKMMGLESQGMVFAIGLSDTSKPALLIPNQKIENGDGAR